MKGIPPEIDALLWRLAEDGGPTARAEFEARHTRYGPELERRIRMVAELRQAGKTPTRRPAFTPRPVRTVPAPRWAIGGAVGMSVLAVGAVAYVLASGGERPEPPKSVSPVPPRTVQAAPATAPPSATPEKPTEIVQKEEPKDESKPAETPKYLLPREVKITDTSLTRAIQLVAASGGLQVTVAPGFEDRKVTFDYPGLNTIETLKAMGNEFDFTVLEEQEGHVLVVPAREQPTNRRTGP